MIKTIFHLFVYLICVMLGHVSKADVYCSSTLSILLLRFDVFRLLMLTFFSNPFRATS